MIAWSFRPRKKSLGRLNGTRIARFKIQGPRGVTVWTVPHLKALADSTRLAHNLFLLWMLRTVRS
jgi:hypothetical protein